jgi:hypothetical protein
MSKLKNIKINIDILKKKVRITKLSDDRFKGNHPNNINEGYVKEGYILESPTIGERFYVGNNFSTSPVTSELKGGIFKTIYSTYKLEYIKL